VEQDLVLRIGRFESVLEDIVAEFPADADFWPEFSAEADAAESACRGGAHLFHDAMVYMLYRAGKLPNLDARVLERVRKVYARYDAARLAKAA